MVYSNTLRKIIYTNTFAFSRVYYVASIIPISKAIAGKFEKLVGKFVWKWSGKVLRVSKDDIRNGPLKGGLGVTCILTMCKSLLISQLLRLLKNED